MSGAVEEAVAVEGIVANVPGVGIKMREIVLTFGKDAGEFGAGVDGPGEDIGDGVSAFHTWVPGHQDCGDAVAPGFRDDGAAAFHDHNGAWLDGGDGTDQFFIVWAEA